MPAATPTSVVLPTTGWTDACEEIVEQLRPRDELLVVCDAERESVADRIEGCPDNARLVIAGEPERCSGKANAIAAGMEAAEHDRIVWTDDDFHHPPEWLETLRADYDRHGPTTELPVFVGRDPLAVLLEPIFVLNATLGVYFTAIPWAGAVVFERDDIDEATFLDDLRRTVSDDGLLAEYADVTAVRRTRRVDIGGSIRESLENTARFAQIVRYCVPFGTATQAAAGALLTAVCLLFPLPALVLSTLAMGAVYVTFGIRRWTFLLTYAVLLASIPLLLYGLARRTFIWGGRRYRWRSKFDVTVESE
ncbi:glycosyltransferase [Natronorubrum texcoconense]|uniref:Glycosyl transferase family 21 n=1 Tax=Natronorubrum texcoconense TaxID=1095776 RepID=A0A1G8XNL8_9EURY|nr:glycosyltransferase family A protein [Natronorubrum texcoconense]SDJ92242.1 Glycosyl transferase family 21 [Natronorubrum texcoconense]